MKHVVMFSGGKDSTAMLLMMIEKGITIDRIINIDTTKEFPEMYKHIEEVKKYIYPKEIETYSFNFDYYFKDYEKVKGKNKGKKGYGWPDSCNRWCTGFKKQLSNKVLKNESKYYEYHGIASDELKRINKNKDRKEIIKLPLVTWGITEKDALGYCYDKGFYWDGLYEKLNRVSCYCCPLSQLGEIKYLYNHRPELWEDMRKLDEHGYRNFRSDYTLSQLEKKFDQENKIDKILKTQGWLF